MQRSCGLAWYGNCCYLKVSAYPADVTTMPHYLIIDSTEQLRLLVHARVLEAKNRFVDLEDIPVMRVLQEVVDVSVEIDVN